MEVLARHGALDGAGRLAADVLLISIGDHFDYDAGDPVTAGAEGLRLLRWLADQPARQVRLLFGNHDAARAMELAGISDERFAQARALAGSIAWDEFLARFPDVPTPGLARRDYASFTGEQRRLVIELLLRGRFHLALAGELPDGRRVLLTHAGLTVRELALLGMPDERDPRRIAAALNARLREGVERCRRDWEAGGSAPLSLEPLHIAGSSGEEGGGLLHHRPARPDRPGADRSWEFDAARPRRYDPRSMPPGLTQVAGHTGHAKCLRELGDEWIGPSARSRARGGIRTLRVTPDGAVRYEMGILPPVEGPVADLILVDGEMRYVPAADYELLSLAGF